MATPPLRTEIADTYPNPTNAVARGGFGKLYDYVTGLLGSTGNAAEARVSLGVPSIAGDTFTGLVKYKTGASITSASTIDLSTATGNTVHITGITAISAVTMSNGQVMDVIFDGALALTHHPTTNKLPSGANITTATGDTARYFYDGSIVYCLSYSRASGATQANRTFVAYTGNSALSATIPFDNSVPQADEGTQILSTTITPRSTTEVIRLRYQGNAAVAGAAQGFISALFVNGVPVAAQPIVSPGSNIVFSHGFEFEHVPGTTSPQTYTIRVGAQTDSTYMNGTTAGRIGGGVSLCSLVAEGLQT
jgi:hypothetical protein